MSYTQIPEKTESGAAAAATTTPPPQVYVPTSESFQQPQGSASYTATAASPAHHVPAPASYGSIGFGPAAILSNVTKLVALVGVFLVAVGLIVALSGYSAVGATLGWIELCAIVAPCVLVLVCFSPGAVSREHLLLFAAVVGLVSTVWAFFAFVANAAAQHDGDLAAAFRAISAGLFFVFLGDGVVAGVSFYARGRDM